MAANMQHIAGPGQMMQQQRRPPVTQIQQLVYQNLLQNTQNYPNGCWQAAVQLPDRMGKIMNLITNVTLAVPGGVDYMKALDFGTNFEREAFQRSASKEAYDQAMSNKTTEFFKKRQANEPNIQNTLNANVQAQAQAHAQAQAMMNMQLGRGIAQGPQSGFQQLQQPMQASQLAQQAQQMGMGMGMGMGMPTEAGRGMGAAQQMMGMPGNQNRVPQSSTPDVGRLQPQDRSKVMELAAKMLQNSSEAQKAHTRAQLQARLPPQQIAELQAQGKDLLMWFYQNQAFSMLRSNFKLQPQGMGQNPNAQAAMMQQQQSQQSMRQQPQPQQGQQSQQHQQGIITGPQNALGNDFTQFAPNLESIKDQQMTGLMAQQAGQMVVPASNGANRNATPQPMVQNMSQQGPNQTPRQQPQPQNQPGVNMQQMKMNQAAQQPQSQLQQGQMKQAQQGMGGQMATSQSPAMNTLNTPPVSRPPNMNPMAGQAGIQFGDQRFNQGTQRPNNAAFQAMLAQMTPDQRAHLANLSQERVSEVMRRWQAVRQDQMGNINGAPANPAQMQNRPQNPMATMNPGIGGQMATAMPQPGAPGTGNAAQIQMPRQPQMNPQAVAVMDQMDLPPQIIAQLGTLPPEIKKWGALKGWLNQSSAIPTQLRGQLFMWQQKQFQQMVANRRMSVQQQAQQAQQQQAQQQAQQQQSQQQVQSGQNPIMAPGMQGAGGQGPSQAQGLQRQMPNLPPQILQVTPQELMHVRATRPQLANMGDEQLRIFILQMKKNTWAQQMRNQQAQNQAALQARPQMQNQQAVPMAQAQMQLQQPPQPNQASQLQNQQAQNAMAPNASVQTGPQKQPMVTPEQRNANARPQTANKTQLPNPSPSQPAKNLKRPSPDDSADVAGNVKATGPAQPAPQQPQQPQQPPKMVTQLSAQQISLLSAEQRAKYEAYLLQKARAPGQIQPTPETLNRLKGLGQEEQRKSAQEVMADILMTPEEHGDTATKLHRIVVDMGKIGRGLSKWYAITRDDSRARMFFHTRLRIMKQFADGEKMSVLKDTFSMRASEIDAARAMLESMAKDLAASVYGRGLMKTNGQNQGQGAPPSQNAQAPAQQPQQQAPQPPQQQPAAQGAQPAPLNAANLAKNTQALSKAAQKQQVSAGKAGQTPVAPTTAQPPFPFGASSPHGNPSYPGGKQKDITLQLPPSRKKQKISGQTPQGATPSPQLSKKPSPEMRRASEAQAPPKPLFLCKEPDCDSSTLGFPTEQALQFHVQEEHMKPKADPMKFVQESLALSLGLEPDGTAKKDTKQQDGAAAMGPTNSRQGQASANLAATPASGDAAMKRTASSAGRSQDTKPGIKNDGTLKMGDTKTSDAAAPGLVADPWANSTLDPQMLYNNLGLESAIGFEASLKDLTLIRSLTPKDTPESTRDSGASEPNSDIPEQGSLEFDFDWQPMDTDMLLNMDDASLEKMFTDGSSAPPTDWSEVQTDFSKPFQFDTSLYSMRVDLA